MLFRKFRPFAAIAIAICTAVLRLPTPRATLGPDTPAQWAASLPFGAPSSGLPDGLVPPTTAAPIVAAIATDLDADGDLDVVGFDGSLNLLVWSNDGAGRFTLRHPNRSTPGGFDASDTSVDDHPATSSVFTAGGGSSLRPCAWTAALMSNPSPWDAALTPSKPHPQFASTRIPRAPPASLLFV